MYHAEYLQCPLRPPGQKKNLSFSRLEKKEKKEKRATTDFSHWVSIISNEQKKREKKKECMHACTSALPNATNTCAFSTTQNAKKGKKRRAKEKTACLNCHTAV